MTNIANECRIANIVRDHAMILPDDATPKPDGIFGKDSAYILADNKLAEKAGWDKQLLAIELQYLIDFDVEIELTGFEMPEIDIILEDAREADDASSGPEDALPPHSSGAPVTRTGDLWVLGNHRLLCADARDDAAYDRLLEGAKAEF